MQFNENLLKKAGFSDKAIDYVVNSHNVREMANANSKGEHTGTCHDTIMVFLRIKDNVIVDASFVFSGCVGSASAGSAITELAKGKSLEEAMEINLKDIIKFYKDGDRGLPKVKHECGDIAVHAMRAAIINYKNPHQKTEKKAKILNDVIALASDGQNMDDKLSTHFGKCQYYLLVNIKNGEINSTSIRENPYFKNHEPGEVPKFVAGLGAKTIIAGEMGQRAIDWFGELGVKVIITKTKTNKEIINDYLNNKLIVIVSACGYS